ncbi:MAG TPA: hypothetical protein VEV84_05260 [Pyrinomonadaceae bacterium]|nr:hypothetical protein [Pyrinomonadaceae bacterium]
MSRDRDLASSVIFDVPCGKGEFLDVIKKYFPKCRTMGADIVKPAECAHEFYQFDAQETTGVNGIKDCEVVTCISGVMEFDNTLLFFEKIHGLLSRQGEFLVTNDNLLTVRDRLLYLFFGRFRQYRHSTQSGAPTWKIIPLQNMIRILSDAQFDVVRIIYVPPKFTEWLWLPLAFPIYLAQYAYVQIADIDVDGQTIREMLPFVSMLSRHYILVCCPKT